MAPNFTILKPDVCGIKGIGYALRVERVLPQEKLDGRKVIYSDGAFRFTIAKQNGEKHFDWDNAISFCLNAIELASMLMVLRNEISAINEGAGMDILTDETPSISIRVQFRRDSYRDKHIFSLDAYEPREGKYLGGIMLSPPESVALQSAIEHSLHLLMFGAPK